MTTNATTKKTTTKAANKTAAEMYAAHRNDIARLLDVLDMELAKHADRAKAEPKNWGLAGDLEMVRSNLIDIVAFIGGAKLEREDVIEFLDDANADDEAGTYTLITRGDGTQVKVSVPTDEA